MTDFAVEATINGFPVMGIMDKEYIEVEFSGSTAPIFWCQSSDVVGVGHNSTFSLPDGSSYLVKGNPEPDGTGITKLILELQ